jgi:hypothetical protein
MVASLQWRRTRNLLPLPIAIALAVVRQVPWTSPCRGLIGCIELVTGHASALARSRPFALEICVDRAQKSAAFPGTSGRCYGAVG